ncbi:MAG: AAA family ATPase [Sedimenticola sp.]|nr:AAA family ATPase [Sedimenticola sp.]
MIRTPEEHARLVAALNRPGVWPGSEKPQQVIETHISSVLLVGDYAYKIKKPLDLGFLDFSTLERRHRFCLEEVRLNGRLAPDIYLDVMPISGTPEAPRPGEDDRVIEYAVRMRRFDPAGLLSLHPELISRDLMQRLATRLADFHRAIAVAGRDQPQGDPDRVAHPMRENFSQMAPLLDDGGLEAELDRLREWTEVQIDLMRPALSERKAGGFIRECHGDLHLGNIALDGDRLLIFDGIEFNPDLRWIDVISELAFLLMDLDEKGLSAEAEWLLNRYLELTGDYEALPLLRFYQVYRAMVRAKVTAIRRAQTGSDSGLDRELADYLALARRYTEPGRPGLVITHGYSGSGKSTQSEYLLTALTATRIRSDLERRRLAGLAPDAASDSALGGGIYRPELNDQTYQRLLQLCEPVIRAGRVAIADATFLKQAQREPFLRQARAWGVPFLILDMRLPEAELRARVAKRQAAGDDPSEATLEVLRRQLETAQPLNDQELEYVVAVESDHLPLQQIHERLVTGMDSEAGMSGD